MRAPTPKPGILNIAAYQPGKATASGSGAPVKLSANENALGCSPAAAQAYRDEAARLHLYPDARVSRLRAAVAERFRLEPERLIFGCGSDELFNFVCQAYLQPGDNVVQPAHGFAAWAIAARAAGGEVRNAPERERTVDGRALLDLVDAHTRIVFVANPANPTGTCLSLADIETLHAALPPDVILVLDEAYAEFASQAEGYGSGLELARPAPNLFVTRTFSKAFGLAALRVGWGYAPAPMTAAMDRIRPPFNVSRAAEAAALAALHDEDFLERSQAHVARWRPVYAQTLQQAGFPVTPSATNFLTFGVPAGSGWTAGALEAALSARGLIVRGLAGYGLADHLRVTIGGDADSERFLGAIGELAAKPCPQT